MGNEYKPPSQQYPRESGDDCSYDWERSIFSVTADDFQDLADDGYADPPDVLTRSQTRLPTVDEFDFEEACAAKDLARRFGPPDSNGSTNRRRWSFSGRPKHLDPVRSASQKRRGRGRGFIWGLSTTILVIMISPALFGIIQPFGDLSSNPAGDQQSDVANGPNGGTAVPGQSSESGQIATSDNEATADGADVTEAGAQSDPIDAVVVEGNPDLAGDDAAVAEGSADIAEAEGEAEPHIIVIPTRSATAGMAFAAPAAAVVADRDGSTIAERSDTPQPAFDPVATVLEPRPIELARPLADAKPVTPPAANAEPATITADNERPKPVIVPVGADSPRRIAQSDEPADVDLPAAEETAALPDKSDEPATGAVRPPGSSLSAEHVDQLLERAGALLRRGDIASARLLFLRIANSGDRRGAKGVGMTYDPQVYARLAVTGLTPDRQQAETWYEKAGDDLAFTIDLAAPETVQAKAPETEEEGSFDRDAACARKYKSYEPGTGLYTAFSGAKRPCRVP